MNPFNNHNASMGNQGRYMAPGQQQQQYGFGAGPAQPTNHVGRFQGPLSNLPRNAEIPPQPQQPAPQSRTLNTCAAQRYDLNELRAFNPFRSGQDATTNEQVNNGSSDGQGGQGWRGHPENVQHWRSSGQPPNPNQNRGNDGAAARPDDTVMSWRRRDMPNGGQPQHNSQPQQRAQQRPQQRPQQRTQMEQRPQPQHWQPPQFPNGGYPDNGHRQRAPMMQPSNFGRHSPMGMQQGRPNRPLPPPPHRPPYYQNSMVNGNYGNAGVRQHGPPPNRTAATPFMPSWMTTPHAPPAVQRQTQMRPRAEALVDELITNDCRRIAEAGGDNGLRGFMTEMAQNADLAMSTFKGSIVLDQKAHYDMLNMSMAQLHNMGNLTIRGCAVAAELAFHHRHRPCFRKIDSLCARLKQDLVRPCGVLANINSQGVAWAVKDFIFVFTRITNAWIILKGYIYNQDDGLRTVNKALCSSFVKSFLDWQTQTYGLLGQLVKAFLQLDELVQIQRTQYVQHSGGKRRSQQQVSNADSNSNSSGSSSSSSSGSGSSSSNSSSDVTADSSSKTTSTESLPEPEAAQAVQIIEPPKYDYSVTMVRDSVGTQVKADLNGSYLPTGSYDLIDSDSYTAALATAAPTAPPSNQLILPDLSIPPPGYQMNGAKSADLVSATANAQGMLPPHMDDAMGNATALPGIPALAQNGAQLVGQFENPVGMSTGAQPFNDTYSTGRILTTATASVRELPTNNEQAFFTATKLSYLKFGMHSFEKLLNSNYFRGFLQQYGPLEGIDFEAAKTAAAVLTEFFTATTQMPKIHATDELLYNITDRVIGIRNGCFALNPSVPQQTQPAIAVVSSPVAMTLAEEREILTNKLNAVVEGLLTMSKAELFFNKRFTKNYFPNYVTIYGDYYLDLQEIFHKCQAREYSNITFIIHDIRKILFFGRHYLEVQQDIRFKTALDDFERELNNFLTQPPFENDNYDHIKGEPNELNTLLSGEA